MSDAVATTLARITTIHTLGPTGTNCESAAYEWFRRRRRKGEVILHATLEQAVKEMPKEPEHALLGCVVYPDLHTLVFSNLKSMVLAECFVFPTFNMLLTSRDGTMPQSVASHPAPQHLIPAGCEVRLVTSNVQAAIVCADGGTDGCITTAPAAQRYGLRVVRDHGPLNMGFTIHITNPEKWAEDGDPAIRVAKEHNRPPAAVLVGPPMLA
jgi:prephenate dehydratase